MKKLWLALLLSVTSSSAWAQNPQCPTRPLGDSTNACASTAFVQSALESVVTLPSVVTCGADPTGVADSTSAINACLVANGAVFVPAGTYKITSPGIQFTALGQSLIGSGTGSTTLLYSGTSGAVIDFSPNTGNSTISGMTIDRTGVPDTTGHGLGSVGNGPATNITLKDLYFTNQYNGLNLFPTYYSLVDNVIATRNYHYGFYMYGTDANPVLQWEMRNTASTSNNNFGYYVQAAPNASSTLVAWTSPTSYANTGGGYAFVGSATGSLNDMNLMNASGGSEGGTIFLINTYGGSNFIVGGFAELAGVTATGRTGSTPPSNVGNGMLLANNINLTISNFQIDNNSQEGILIAANNAFVIISETKVTKSGHALSNTYDGISIVAGAGTILLSGIVSGNYVSETNRYGIGNANAGTTILTGSALTGVTAGCGGSQAMTGSNNSGTGCPIQSVAQGGTGLSSGTSGGILAFTAAGTLASSGALTANLPVIGGGAGVAPSVGTRSGNTTTFVTTTGTQTSGNCVTIDASGNHIANGSACQSGTVTSIATTSPITGGTITTTGTIACATCVTSAAALTSGRLVAGAGSQAAAVTNLTGDVTTSGGVATTIANNAVTLAKLATQATNTVLGNATSGTAVPTALSMTSCSTSASAVIWTTNTGFGCNTSITAAAVPASGLTGTTLASGVVTSSLTALGTITSLTATTINAFTLGGTIAGGGNQINNVVIGTSTPLAGSFTSIVGTSISITTSANLANGIAMTDGVSYSAVFGSGAALGTPAALQLGTTGGNAVAFLAQSVEIMRITTGLSIGTATDPGTGGLQVNAQQFNPNMALDTATLDSTVCTATTGGKFLKGTGTIGVCLGSVSSRRFKDDIYDIGDSALQLILELKPKTFYYKPGYGDNGTRLQYGFIAEDTINVLPALTRTDDLGNANGVDILGMVPVVIAAIKQLKADNDNLRADIEELKRSGVAR